MPDFTPWGSEIFASTTVTSVTPDAAAIGNGRFVVAFRDGPRGTDAEAGSVWAHVYDAFGVEVGPEFQLNTVTAGYQGDVRVVGLTGGGFAAVWRSGTVNDLASLNYVGRIFDVNGAPVTAEFAVNTTTAGTQQGVDLIALDNGGFTAAWANSGTVSLQRITSTGAKDGGEYTISGAASDPQLISYANGSSLLAWFDGSGFEFQRFDANGATVGSVTPISWSYSGNLTELQPLGADGFLMLVRGHNTIDSEYYARTFDGSGAPTAGAVEVQQFAIGFSTDVVAMSNGTFAVGIAGNDAFGNNGFLGVRNGLSPFGPTLSYAEYGHGTYPSAPNVLELTDGRLLFVYDSALSASQGRIAFHIADGRGALVNFFNVPGDHWITGADVGPYANNTLIGFTGADRLYGFGGDDSLWGYAGDDVLIAGFGNDTMVAGDGNDYAAGESGNDAFYGGAGDDIAYGGDGSDILVGEAGADLMNGEAGDDYVFGGADADNLAGGDGVDVLIGEDGNDVLNGGAGDDYLYGGPGDDTASGEQGNDLFVMGAGNDNVNGGDGNDFVYGGAGADTIDGGAGSDVLLGEAGDDVITPGLGVDYVFLGTGADTLVVDKNAAGQNVAVLYDFTPGAGDGDVLLLLNTGWTSVAQVQAATFDTGNGYSILSLDADTAIWIVGVAPGQLTAGDVLFA